MRVIPLHLHSHWSLLDGVPSVGEVVDFAQAADLPAIALTDTNAMYGAIEFVASCRKAGLAPLLGAQLTLAGGAALPSASSVVVLAQNMQGYGNLCRLISRLQASPEREAALARGLSLADLAQHAEGLIALSGGHAGPLDACLGAQHLAQAESVARELSGVFGRDRFCIELQIVEDGDADKAATLQSLADRLRLRTVATHDIHYLSPADAPRYRVLTAMRTGRRLADLPRLPDLSFPAEDELRRRFAAFPAALDQTGWIADASRFEFPLGQRHFPALDLPPGRTTREELWTRALDGAKRRYGELTPAIEARLRKEVDVIDTLGYTPYVLVVADIVRFAREKHVPISPRGSASSSVAAYCLGIHDVDPIAHQLYFERFLSLERRDPPDIDLDLCSHRRDEVIQYVYRTYGADHVAMVCTYATLRARYALHEVGKVYGLSESRIKQLSKQLPGFWHPGARSQRPPVGKRMQDAQAELIEQTRDSTERQVLEMSRALDGTPHHLSIHPGGIVISPGPITDLAPLQHATKGLLVTQFDMGGIEKLGLVKIDLLGISALTVIADCIELIQARQPEFTLESIPLQDDAAAQALSTARTIGCFQIESPGMRMTLRELAAHSVNDLIVALALYRPGPLKGGLKDAFVRRHASRGQESAEYLHPALEPILRETYGVILYQEQVLRLAHEVAGLTLGEADLLRRAMSKFRSAHEMERLHQQFIAGAQATSGLDAATAQQVWELMAAFAGYGFPKAHAAGYAAVAYRMAYLKTHYPAEFMTARLAVWGGFYRPSVYMSEARRLGLAVRPPHVNHSHEVFTLEPPRTLWMGLGQVRDLTHTTTKTILAGRPFQSLEDFLVRAQPQYVEAVNLVQAGALKALGSAGAMLAQLVQDRWHGRHTSQMGLPALSPAEARLEPTLQEQADWERQVLGLSVSVHPLQLAAGELEHMTLARSDELGRRLGEDVTLAGVRLAAHRLTARHERRLLVDMEDEHGLYQVLWSGAALERALRGGLLAQREPVLVRGRVRTDRQGQVVVAGHEIEAIAQGGIVRQ